MREKGIGGSDGRRCWEDGSHISSWKRGRGCRKDGVETRVLAPIGRTMNRVKCRSLERLGIGVRGCGDVFGRGGE